MTAPLPRPGRRRLTERHVEVLRLAAQGMTNAQIGKAMFLSEDTVKTHMRRAFDALGARNRTQAVLAMNELGLLGERPSSSYAGPERRIGVGRRRTDSIVGPGRGDASRSRPAPSRP